MKEKELKQSAEQAYVGALGNYNSQLKRLKWTKADMVANINKLFKAFGLDTLPEISPKTLGKMGLKGVPGITPASK